MEKQLIDALKGADRISDLDEVSKYMIMSRAQMLLKKAHAIVDKFTDDFRELVENDEELCDLMGISCIFAYSDGYCKMCASEEGNPDKAVKATIVYGSEKETQLLYMKVMLGILKESDAWDT